MRRVVSFLLAALGVLGAGLAAGAPAAWAAPTPAPAGQAPPAGKTVCTITSPRLNELSGIVATADGYVVMNDSTNIPDRKRIFFLDAGCKITDEISYPGGPRDPEDLALSPDHKTLWIGDIGDNDATDAAKTRSTVALWKMPVSGSSKPVIYRMSYPDGDHHDAEALLIAGNGTPVIITKELSGKALLYSPTGPLKANVQTGVPLKRVGEVTLPRGSTTDNPMKAAGRVLITGAARSPDGSKVALRTLADAYEYDVTNGDVVAALTTGTPRMTPLPNEAWGEAISYTPDGKSYVTVSDVGNLANPPAPVILRYAPTDWLAHHAATGTGPTITQKDDRSWWQKMSLKQMEYGIAAFGLLGALLVLLGVFGILRARKRPAGTDGLGGDNAATAMIPQVRDDYGYEQYYDAYGYSDAYPQQTGGGQGGGRIYGGGQSAPTGYGEPEYPYDPAGYGYPENDRGRY
ncbi:MAG TPA: hypothetical protein VGJ63_21800 [Micromonosporaceae bacterium]|jgi:hypothetical protein